MTRRLPHRLAVLATIAVAGLGLVACSGGSTTSSGTGGGSAAASAGASAGASGAAGAGCSKPIGVSVADQKSLFYVAAVQGMQAAADKAGCELKVTSANNNSSQQVEQVNDLLNQDIGALVFISQDSTAAAAGVRAANQADVPVVAVDQRPESGSGELATYIATDSVKAAHQLCTWLFQQMGGSGELAILHGVLGSTAEIQRTQGCQDALAENPNIKLVAEDTANWDETEAFTKTQNILTANPNLKAVFGESDAMAIGAAKAAQQAGRTGMNFVGIDGFPTMFDAVASGLTQATMAQQPYKMGELAVEQAVGIVNGTGAELPAEQYQDTVLITKDNVATQDVTTFYGPDARSIG
jgi:ribose transport system substrate-binding protein